jgi:O-antigen/teichoic acid export membrane protein
LPGSLRAKTIHALFWSFIESIGLQSIQFVIGIILARLLFPEQFGLIAMLAIFLGVSESFINSGFGAALIQKKDPTHTDKCSIFFFNILVGLILAGILCLAAPWIAAFYNEPILTPLTRALSLTIIINSFGLIQTIILTKEIDFKSITKVSLTASVPSGAIGITMAVLGYGVWSLVAQQILSAVFRATALWFFSPWRPSMIVSIRSLREMFGYGSRMLASGLLNRIFENVYLLVIGKMFSATALGFFARAQAMQDIPTQTLSGMVGRVTFPVFSSIQDDHARMKRGVKKALTLLVLINFPIMIGIAAVAHPLVLVLLTEKWAPCIPYLQLLCFVGLLYPVHLINLNALQALGRSDLFLRLEIIKKVMIVINIAVTWQWGIPAMISGMLVLSVISFYLNGYYTGRLIDYRFGEQLSDLTPYLLLSALMGAAVYLAGFINYPNYWFMLLTQITIGMVTYIVLCRMFRLPAFMEVWQGGWDSMRLLRNGSSG